MFDPSKSLTLDQADAVLAAAAGTSMHAYVVLSLLTGARTEELRALTWSHLDLDGNPPSIELWHSLWAGGDTKRGVAADARTCRSMCRGASTS